MAALCSGDLANICELELSNPSAKIDETEINEMGVLPLFWADLGSMKILSLGTC